MREDAAVGRSSSSGVASPDVAKDSPRGKSIGFVASPTTAPTSAPTGSSMMKDPWKAKQVKSANAALAAELQLLQQYKLREKQYAKQTNAATPFKYVITCVHIKFCFLPYILRCHFSNLIVLHHLPNSDIDIWNWHQRT